MSALDAHAKAARILGEHFSREAAHPGMAPDNRLLSRFAKVYLSAADHMETLAREEAIAGGGLCSVDHATLKVPRCPACGEPRKGAMKPPAGDPV